nr:delta(7)-sterol 5(6)-desaturase [Quercus suber]
MAENVEVGFIGRKGWEKTEGQAKTSSRLMILLAARIMMGVNVQEPDGCCHRHVRSMVERDAGRWVGSRCTSRPGAHLSLCMYVCSIVRGYLSGRPVKRYSSEMAPLTRDGTGPNAKISRDISTISPPGPTLQPRPLPLSALILLLPNNPPCSRSLPSSTAFPFAAKAPPSRKTQATELALQEKFPPPHRSSPAGELAPAAAAAAAFKPPEPRPPVCLPAMDVVLEIFDTLLFDRIYANVLPIQTAVASFDPISTIAASFGKNINATWDPAASLADSSLARSGWQYTPASQSFSLQPSEYAWQSRWDRDNIWRQAVSLYAVTW